MELSYDVDKSDEANAARLRKLLSLGDGIYYNSIRHLRVNFDVPANSQQLDKMSDWLAALIVVLPVFMAKVRRLETLAVRNVVGYAELASKPVPEWSVCMAKSRMVSESVIKGLRYVPLPHLKRLSLYMPASVELARLVADGPAQQSMETAMRHLRHLDIGIWDCVEKDTGPWIQPDKVPLQPPPFFRNKYSALMLGVMSTTPNRHLESLSIDSHSSLVSLDGLGLQNLVSLRSLHLSRVKVEGLALLRIVAGSRRTLQTVHLDQVLLNEGKWAWVLCEMARLGDLCRLRTYYCGYDANGASNHWCADPRFMRTSCRDIATASIDDLKFLGRVQRTVNANRAVRGLEPVPETEFYHLFRDEPEPEPKPAPASPQFDLPDGFDDGEWDPYWNL